MSDYKNNNSLDEVNLEEEEQWEQSNENLSNHLITLNKNIIIYSHNPFFLSDGGIVVQYYLASV